MTTTPKTTHTGPSLTLRHCATAIIILLIMVGLWFNASTTQAASLTGRSVTISTALNSATTTHQFRFSINTISSVGSISFMYCDNSPLFDEPCNPPAGLDASSAVLSSQSGQIGFSIHPSTTASTIVISRPPIATIAGAASYTFDNVVNPSQPNRTTYVRIATYATSDGSGSATDQGAVAFSLGSGLAVNAFIPPYLAVCVGVTVAPNCATTNGLGINLGTLSSHQARAGTTQVGVATNDAGGYTLSILGNTMTAGNNFIPPLSTPTGSIPGTGQFGINLRANTDPAGGQDTAGNGSGAPTNSYNQANLFLFHSGDTIASSNQSTDFNVFTVSYLANIPGDQAPGTYTTTMTYTGLATF
ncbi:MAG TPA: hypothetical protein VLE74_03125 [Candidatus Saccharimonadales bacterium]|nr:hypothetical protein [Candidatus Saccharimonadales bacterium]